LNFVWDTILNVSNIPAREREWDVLTFGPVALPTVKVPMIVTPRFRKRDVMFRFLLVSFHVAASERDFHVTARGAVKFALLYISCVLPDRDDSDEIRCACWFETPYVCPFALTPMRS